MTMPTVRSISQTWGAWGMPPRQGETERPPVPSAPTWHMVTPDGPLQDHVVPDLDPMHWYRSTDGTSFVFRHAADAERFAASI